MRIEVTPGDITQQVVDVVVNAANSGLLGGGGVDGAIHAAAGPELLEECRRLRRTTLPDGCRSARPWPPVRGGMPARWVVHTVGPNAHRGERDPALLASCFTQLSRRRRRAGGGVRGLPCDQCRGLRVARGRGRPGRRRCRPRVGPDAARAGEVELVRFVPFGAAATTAFEQALRG